MTSVTRTGYKQADSYGLFRPLSVIPEHLSSWDVL